MKIKIDYGKLIRKTGKVFYGFIFVAIFIIAGSVALSTLKIPGNYKVFVVQSGSMEPKIKRMGIVVVKPAKEYKKGDVITVAEPANPKVTLTHRVVDIEEKTGRTFFVTKGDANEDPDTEKRPAENVLGKVILSVPFLGYPVSFAKTQTGFIALIVIPAVLIVYSELLTIKNEALRLIAARKHRRLSAVELAEVKIGKEVMAAEREAKVVEKKVEKTLKNLS